MKITKRFAGFKTYAPVYSLGLDMSVWPRIRLASRRQVSLGIIPDELSGNSQCHKWFNARRYPKGKVYVEARNTRA